MGPSCQLSIRRELGPVGSTWPRLLLRWLQPPGGTPAWGREGRPGAQGQGHEEVTPGHPARGLPALLSRGPTSWPPCQGLLVQCQPLFWEPPLARPHADLGGSSGLLVAHSLLLPQLAWGWGSSGGVQSPVSSHRGSQGCTGSRAVGLEHRQVRAGEPAGGAASALGARVVPGLPPRPAEWSRPSAARGTEKRCP